MPIVCQALCSANRSIEFHLVTLGAEAMYWVSRAECRTQSVTQISHYTLSYSYLLNEGVSSILQTWTFFLGWEFVFTSSSARTTSSARVVVTFFFPFPCQSFISTSTGPITSVHFETVPPPCFQTMEVG